VQPTTNKSLRLDRRPTNLQPTPETEASGLFSETRIGQLTWAFVALGVTLRLTRWLLRFPIWHDEAFVAVNFIDRDYLQLLQPLDYLQVSPLGFLFLEKLAVDTFGFSELSLRLVPTLAAIAALFAFRDLATRLLTPFASLLAVAILAVAQSPLRHGNEVKPYSIDLLMAAVLLDLAVRWWQNPERTSRLWALAAFVPFAIVLSMPAVFIAGGIALSITPAILQSNRRHTWIAFLAFVAALAASFTLVMALSMNTEATEVVREIYLDNYWSSSFPPLSDGIGPGISWLASIHSGNLFAYPIGGEGGASSISLALFIIGAVALLRSRNYLLLTALVAPFGLNLLAAAMKRYPYGGEARIAQHLAPAICLLAALGADRLLAHLRSRRAWIEQGLIGLLLVIGAGQFTLSLVKPYQLESSQRARGFARWFWPTMAHDGSTICVKTEHRRDFEPWQWVTGISAEYLCNQRIYRPARVDNQGPAADRPLRCVVYQVETYGPIWDKPAFRDWIDPLREKYRLDRITTYPVNVQLKGPDWKHEYYHVFEFLPRDANSPHSDALDKLLERQEATSLASAPSTRQPR
jgi:hypothetical protein